MRRKHHIALAFASIVLSVPALADGFLSPAWWGLEDAGTTHQQWDVFTTDTGNPPDVSRLTDGTALPDPMTGVTPPAFATGGGNFYSFAGPYSVMTDIANYGAGPGTHVIVQTSASMNPDPGAGGPASVFIDSLRIEDGTGTVLPGGSNAEALQAELVAETVDGGPMGEIAVEWLIWEFYLPGHAGDFEIVSDSIVHSSFRELRVDTAVAAEAYPITPVPEPGTLVLLGVAGVLLRRRG